MTLDEKRDRLIAEIRELWSSGNGDTRRKLMLVLQLTKTYQSLKANGQRVRLARGGLIRIDPPPPHTHHLYPGLTAAEVESAEREFYRCARRMSELKKRLNDIDEQMRAISAREARMVIRNRYFKNSIKYRDT